MPTMQKTDKTSFAQLMVSLIENDQLTPVPMISRPGDQPNEDYLIPRVNLYTYIDKNSVDDLQSNGILVNKDINGVRAFFSRIPTDLQQSNDFYNRNVAVKISILKLKKSPDAEYEILGKNFPKLEDKLIKLKPESIAKFSNSEDILYGLYKKSTKPDFSDTPHVIIRTKTGIPAYACTVLHDDKV